jgi:hypothetical protein
MTTSLRDLCGQLSQRFGAAWNRFWFTPSDPVVVCALRAATGAVALYLLLTFSPDLRAFFAAGGLLPADAVGAWAREHASPGFWTVDRFSYLSYVSDPTTLTVLHVIGLAVLLAFTLGLFTRATSIASLVVVLSYMHRAPMLVSYVEPVVAMMLFYLCLAPCGACLSIDALWQNRRGGMPGTGVPGAERGQPLSGSSDVFPAPPQPQAAASPWATVATRLMQIHVAGLYLMIALSQLAGGSAGPWWDGAAVWMLAARPEMPLVDMTWLAGHPFLIDVLTRFIVCVELAFPLLVWHRPLRPFVLALAALMWGLVALLTGLAAFGLMMTIASLAFVPPRWLRALLARAMQPAAAAAPRGEVATPAGTSPSEGAEQPSQPKPSRKAGKHSRQPARTR